MESGSDMKLFNLGRADKPHPCVRGVSPGLCFLCAGLHQPWLVSKSH